MYTQIYNTVFSKSEFQQCPTTQSKLITIANRRALFNWVSKNQIQSDDNCQSEKRLPWLFMIKARENASDQVVIGLHLIGWDCDASFLDQSHNEVKQNQSNPASLLILSWKLL